MLSYDELCDFLDSEDNEYGLDHIATHGFLCATIVGPSLKDWQDVLFENQQDSLPAGVLAALEDWRKNIRTQLKEEEAISLPILADGEDDEMEITVESELGDWSAGFVDAMYANEEYDWFDTAADHDSDEDEIATLTLPMVVFSGIEEDDEDLADMRASPELMAEMADAVVKNVSELYLIFGMPA